MNTLRGRNRFALAALLVIAVGAPAIAAQPAKTAYTFATTREKALRAEWDTGHEALPAASLRQARQIVQAYESVVRDHPTSGYCDNALWQAAALEADLFNLVGQEADRQKAVSLFEFLAREYPSSPLAGKANAEARRLRTATPPRTREKTVPEKPAPQRAAADSKARNTKDDTRVLSKASEKRPSDPHPTDSTATRVETSKPVTGTSEPARTLRTAGDDEDSPAAKTPPARTETGNATLVGIKDIKRTILPEIVRVSIELERQVAFHEERVENPARLLFDLPGTKATGLLQDANWSYQDDVVRKIRVGRHPNHVTRVVLDLEGVGRYSVVTLADPYRILIDCERMAQPSAPAAATSSPARAVETATKAAVSPDRQAALNDEGATDRAKKGDAPKAASEKSAAERPVAPPANDRNRVSMARQLGLGVSRVVIDPGHGGHDPGAEGDNANEAAVVLDIALRLEKLLSRQSTEVVLTRRTDVFVPLEERTAMANREQADLFLSIHANASRNQKAHGIESYYLNFATDPDAEAVAARENAASGRTMNSLPDIVKAIALNNKLDESKDFAKLVQQAMGTRLRTSNKSLRDLGVKKAPFVVLIGAAMPSVLVEVSFLTNKREGQLLRSEAYRQRIAEALCDAVVRYRRTLKSTEIIASQ